MSGNPLVITKSVWHDAMPQTPTFGPDEFGLKFVLVPALRGSEATVALLGSGHLPGRFDAVYGGRIPGALQIVAVHLRNGRVYHNAAEPGHMPPLSAQMRPDPGPNPVGPGVTLVATKAIFNVDMRGQLGLDAGAGEYAVFVWLDDLVTPVQVAAIPPTSVQSAFVPPMVAASAVQFRRLAESPPAAAPVALKWLPDGLASGGSGPHLLGTVAPDLIPAKKIKPEDRPKLTLIGKCFKTRDFRLSVDFPQSAIDDRTCSFDLPLDKLVAIGATPDKGFILACVGKAVSPVLVVAPK